MNFIITHNKFPESTQENTSSKDQSFKYDTLSLQNESNTSTDIEHLIITIDKLQNELKLQTDTVKQFKMKVVVLTKELKTLKLSIAKYLEPDQIAAMSGKRVFWSNKTLKKGLILRYKLGDKFYNKTLRGKYGPFPEKSTLLRHIEKFTINPGILHLNIRVLAAKMQKIPRMHRSIGLLFDDKAIIPGCQRQKGSSFVGNTTLLPSKAIQKKEGDSPRAKNALVVLAVGTAIREKEIVGLHYVAGCTDGESLKSFLFELIAFIEEKADLDVDWLGFDCGPSNQSFLNACGLSLSSGNKEFFIQHPHRPSDRLYFKPDDVHNKKNLISALRKNDFKFAPCLVKLFNLNGSKVSFLDVKKLFNTQEKIKMKPAKRLKLENITPQHFETMRERVAYEVFSNDVFTAIQFGDKNANKNNKKNPTAAFLQIFNAFHKITDDKNGWSSTDKLKYEEDIEFLKWFAEEFIPNLKLKSSLRCVPAMIMSINCLVSLSKKYFDIGYERVVPAWFLSNAIENIFSMVTNIFKKPTAATMATALRIISLQQFDFEPTSTSYAWDTTESPSIDILELIKSFADSKITENIENEAEDIDLQFIIEIRDDIKVDQLFATELEINVFYIETTQLLTSLMVFIKCEECKEILVDDSNVETPKSRLFMLKQESARTPQKLFKPSGSLWKFFLRLEFIFQELCKLKPADDKAFSTLFIKNASNVLVPDEHCFVTSNKIISSYLKKRLTLQLQCYLPHRAVKQASKSLL